MIKGCRRSVYYVKNPGSPVFDEAYFILNRRVSAEYIPGLRHIHEAEMSEEAERIAREVSRACTNLQKPPLSPIGKGTAFALGALSSSALIGAMALLLAFL